MVWHFTFWIRCYVQWINSDGHRPLVVTKDNEISGAAGMRNVAAACIALGVALWMRPSPTPRLFRVLNQGVSRTFGIAKPPKTLSVSSAAQAPLVADLLSAAIEAGLPVSTATEMVHSAVTGTIANEVEIVVRAYSLGAGVDEAWRRLGPDSVLAPISHAVIRSYDSGAAVSPALRACATDMRREHRARAEIAARSAGVRAIGPLTACFLPAFLLLGVLPLVASLAEQVFTG
jgi:Flp pilus assembly protein TadB